MAETVVDASGLGKRYKLGSTVGSYQRLTESLSTAMRSMLKRDKAVPGDDHVWALRDVSFKVEAGEVVGIIGRNGAGKTTLLKILSRITAPTEGEVELRGRVGALLEVGTGFHPELTGRENISLNGAILGMPRAEVQRRFDDIVAFAEIDRFVDTPVKRYSSGMYVRLAFSVAAHLEPEVLIIDEVLAVGDIAFQRKCLGKMGDVASEGRTVLFVSHNMGAVKSLCSRAILLEAGRIVATGGVGEVIDDYVARTSEGGAQDLSERLDRKGDGALRLTRFSSSGTSLQSDVAVCGAATDFIIEYEAERPLTNVNLSMAFYSTLGDAVMHLSNEVSGRWFGNAPARGAFRCRFEKLPLLPGLYDVNLHCTVNGSLADWITSAARIQVSEGDFYGSGKLPPPGYGAVLTDHDWMLDERT